MDGLLVIDKPVGPSSHEVVARVRKILGELRVGHTGTLDPLATGVLPLVLGRATRLARFFAGADKTYRATIRLGTATDTYDRTGKPVGLVYGGPLPSRERIEEALAPFRGVFPQQPPAFSAKKIDGRRSYRLARARARSATLPAPRALPAPELLPAPVPVVVHALGLEAIDGPDVTLRIDCSAGFYVRSLAHDLGQRLGTGAHLNGLQRIRSGDATLEDAVPLDRVSEYPEEAVRRVIGLRDLLPRWPAVILTDEAVWRVRHGREVSGTGVGGDEGRPFVRLLDPAGELIGMAEPGKGPGLLHPSIVLM